MSVQANGNKFTLFLALLVGMSLHASFSVLFNSHVSFSFFPLISLCFSVYHLHHRYLIDDFPPGLASIVSASFFLGIFGYNAFIRAQFAEQGPNFLSTVVSSVLVIWIYYRWSRFKAIEAV